MIKRKRVIRDDAYWEEQRRLVAEDGGHMGWTRDHFPECNDTPVMTVTDECGKEITVEQPDLF